MPDASGSPPFFAFFCLEIIPPRRYNKGMKKKLLFASIFVLAAVTSAFAQLPPSFSTEWEEEALRGLEAGKIVIRNIQRCKNISIKSGINPYADKVIKTATDINANYLAEIIYRMPKQGNEDIIDQAVKIFEDIALYKDIIYSDEKKGSQRNLFPLVEQRFRNDAPGLIQIGSHLKMDMLSPYDSQLQIEWGPAGFFFQQKNVSALMWRSFKAVKEENMIAAICCFEWNGDYYVYALGGLRAPRIPFVIAEIERQFIGRIEDFTVFYINKFNIKKDKR